MNDERGHGEGGRGEGRADPSEGDATAIEFVTEEELHEAEGTPGVVRKVAFRTENNVMVQSRVAGATATGWHHHGDRHVYGYLLEGRGIVEYGSGDRERIEGNAPGFFHIPPGVVHRDINPDDEEQVVLINFVGSGPVVVNVDAPDDE